MSKITEKKLDKALDDKFKNSQEFTNWFLSKTKFASEIAEYHWSRSNHPWGLVPITVVNPETGTSEQREMESETDVLVVFETKHKTKIALHIENKLANGKFTPFQPELYSERAKLWQGKSDYHEYADFETILIAPLAFYERWTEDCKKFDRYISHEEISKYIEVFGQ